MRCAKCGCELEEGTAVCPVCGEKAEDTSPIYRAEVKGLLKSGELIVYRDRAEFIVSRVQKMTFPYSELAAVRKGLDRISFVMEDGRTESCTVNRKILHEAFYVIEQACKPYLERRDRQLDSEGVRFSFPSSPAGLGGVLSSGLLHIMDDRCEYAAPSGKKETVDYRDVKAARISAMGALEFTMYDGSRKAYTVGKEQRPNVAAFYETALKPFIEERRARLLSQGIYFSFPNSQSFGRGTLNIYADRLEYVTESGQGETVPFPEIRAVRATEGSLETALVDGATKRFPIDRDQKDEVQAFMDRAIAPYVEKRTKGFDVSFGVSERLEIQEERGVFHVIRQGGREISREYPLSALTQAELYVTKAAPDLVSTLLSGRGGDAGKPPEERISGAGVLLTVQSGEGTEKVPVSFGSFTFGARRTSPEFERCAAEQSALAAYLAEHVPQCGVILPPPPQEAPAPAPAEEAAEETAKETPASGGVARGQFGTLIDGISDFVQRCGTPMTVAIEGDWESGDGSFTRMIYERLRETAGDNALWLSTWGFARSAPTEQLPGRLAEKLGELLGGGEGRTRARMLAQGVIGIASGLLSQGSSDGQKLTDALFGSDLSGELEQKVRQVRELIRRRAEAGGGRVFLFVDDLNRLAPARAVEVLEALRYFSDCPGGVFFTAVDRERVRRGRQELSDREGREEDTATYYDRLFKTAFRVPESSFDVHRYIADNLERAGVEEDGDGLDRYVRLAALSTGGDPKALERVFNAFLLLRSVSAQEDFLLRRYRLTVFGLLCMQSRFPEAYRALSALSGRLTPEGLSAELSGSALPEDARQAFSAFAPELCAAAGVKNLGAISQEDCDAFGRALSASALTPLK